jgi:hypothetical protein
VAEQLRQQRIQQSAASIAAATPACAVLGGGPLERPLNEAMARAATVRINRDLKARMDKEAADKAAFAAGEERKRAEAQQTQAQARNANAERARADAAEAAQQSRAAWASCGMELHEAFTVLSTSPAAAERTQSAAQLLQILTAIRDNPDEVSKYGRLNMRAPRFPSAPGSLALLMALGFAYDEPSDRLVLPAGGCSRAALAAVIGQLGTLVRPR